MKKTFPTVGTCLLLAFGLAPALAQGTDLQNAPPGIETTTAITAKATVQAINPKNRTVTLKDQSGKVFTANVPEEARNFNQLRKGDQVSFRHIETLALSLQNPNEPAASGQMQTLRRAPLGQKPAGEASTITQVTATVEKIDPQKREVTLRLPENKTMTVQAGENIGAFDRLKPGDQLTAAFTETYQINVSRANR